MMKLKDPENCLAENGNKPWRSPISSAGTARMNSGDKLHHKFAVVDQNRVIFGSQNWTSSGAHENDENVIVIENPYIAAEFLKEYKRLLKRSVFGPSQKLIEKIRANQEYCATTQY